MLSLVLMNFMNRNSRMDDRGLDCLLLDYWLYRFVHVMMNVLSSDSGRCSLGVLSVSNCASALELSGLSLEALLDVIVIAVLHFAGLDTGHLMGVLLWENLAILDRLHRCVVVILMDLAVNCSANVLLLSLGDVLVGDSWVYSLVNGGVVLSIFVKERSNCCLSFLHIDDFGYLKVRL